MVGRNINYNKGDILKVVICLFRLKKETKDIVIWASLLIKNIQMIFLS